MNYRDFTEAIEEAVGEIEYQNNIFASEYFTQENLCSAMITIVPIIRVAAKNSSSWKFWVGPVLNTLADLMERFVNENCT